MTERISIRNLKETELHEADRIMRLAFGTFLGLPDPMTFMGDAAYVQPRWLTDPSAAFAAEFDGTLVGSSFAANWGNFGYFGPLTVHPEQWDRGIAKRLMETMVGCFDRWGTRTAGLFTFAHSQKHVGLYQKFGFWPQYLTAIMSKRPAGRPHASWNALSQLPLKDHESVLRSCRDLTDSIYEGLDVRREIVSVRDQNLGDTLLVWSNSSLDGFAVCHFGRGTEAGSGRCYVKFAAARSEAALDTTLDACETLAATKNLSTIIAGVNTSRHEAYRHLITRGFRTDYQGVAMQRPNDRGFNRPSVYVIDDWR
jgi:GNAT superfamily N-acetyltransferase